MSEKFITISSFDNPVFANLAKSKLESEGISCYLPDENIISVNMLYSSAVGNIKLQVHEADAEKAIKILNTDESSSIPLGQDLQSNKESNPCPECKSSSIEDMSFKRKYPWLSVLFIGVPVIISARKWHCMECDYSWEEKIPLPLIIVRIIFSATLIIFIIAFAIYAALFMLKK